MAGKITELTALTAVAAATTDLIETVDISDTSMAATGTNKKMTLAELSTYLLGTVTAWNPAPTGLTKGNGVQNGWSYKQGRSATISYDFVLGTTSAITGNFTFTLPYTALGTTFFGGGYVYDSSPVELRPIVVTSASNTVAVVSLLGFATNESNLVTLGPDRPWVWGAGDQIAVEMTYLTAS